MTTPTIGACAPDGFGYGHYNGDTGYNRPPIGGDSMVSAPGWSAIMGAAGMVTRSRGQAGDRQPPRIEALGTDPHKPRDMGRRS